jgi:hypothetical protein
MRLLFFVTLVSWAAPIAAQSPAHAEADAAVVDGTRGAARSTESTGLPVGSVPPPPTATTEVSPGPVESFTFGDHAPMGLGHALWAQDRDTALAAIDDSPTISRAVACVEAVLRELALVAEYLPRDPPVDRLSARLFDDTRSRVTRAFELTSRAHRRCLAAGLPHDSMRLVGPNGPVQVALEDELATIAGREAELTSLAPRVASEDPVEVHAALAAAIGIEIDSTRLDDPTGDGTLPPATLHPRDTLDVSHVWNVASAFYVLGHGRLPTPDERKVEPTWRLTPLLVGAMELVLGLALIPVSAGMTGGVLDDARVRLGLIGMSVSGVVSLLLFPTWLERDRRGRLLASGLATLAALGVGLATSLADVRPRVRAFGIALTAGSAIDAAFWIGGAVIQRRWRPNASFSRSHASLGGSFAF